MDFSIITPSFNQAEYVQRCLDSVGQQGGASFEHIIMDGGSSDATIDVLRDAPSHVSWLSEDDQGQSDALAKALKQASGTYLGWLNVDEYYEPGVFERVKRVFEENPDAVVVYGDFRRVDAHGNTIRVNRQWQYDRMVGALVTPIIQNCSAFFSMQRVKEVGGFDSVGLDYVMDWDLFIRIMSRGGRAILIPEVLGNYTMHPLSKTSAGVGNFLAEAEILRQRHFPQYSARRLKVLWSWHFLRMMVHMQRRGVLLDKLYFKLFRQQEFAAEYGSPGTSVPVVRHLRKLSPWYWRHGRAAKAT